MSFQGAVSSNEASDNPGLCSSYYFTRHLSVIRRTAVLFTRYFRPLSSSNITTIIA